MDRSVLCRTDGKFDFSAFNSVEQAIEEYLTENRGMLDAQKESTKFTIQKIAGILKPLVPFLNDRGVVHMKGANTEHLVVLDRFSERSRVRLRTPTVLFRLVAIP